MEKCKWADLAPISDNSAMRRKHDQELLDNEIINPAALSGNLLDIARLNRWTGTTAAVLNAVEEMTEHAHQRGELVVLDIGTGSGELPTALMKRAARKQLTIRAFGGDFHAGVLDHARQYADSSGWLRLEATCLPIASGGVDIAVCTQMSHHLEPEPLKRMLIEMQRISRIGFIIVDLERSKIAQIALWLVTRLISRNPLTRHDGPLSIERAYTRPEIMSIASSAGINLEVRALFPFRWIATRRIER